MQDPRIRLLAACLLSAAAFISMIGAVAAVAWWLVFTSRLRCIRHRMAVLAAGVLFCVVALVIYLSGGDGVSYLIRMTAILLIGTWLYADSVLGDFPALGTWLLGPKTGFELGMTAGMAVQAADELGNDFARIRLASAQKQVLWGIRSAISGGRVLVCDALMRADEMAELLAVRGYRKGGTCCPRFRTPVWDIVAGVCAGVVILVAVFPVSEFFILYR
jgi:energy-coupling factor transport system permease protein